VTGAGIGAGWDPLTQPARPPRPAGSGARSTSLDTRQKARIGSPAGDDPLWAWLQGAGNRIEIKELYALVLAEIARRAEDRGDYERFQWFTNKSAAVDDCTKVRVVPHRGTDHGVATPISCHVRGEPDCERARVAKLIGRHDDAALAAARPVFLTLTSRNAPLGELGDARRRQAGAFTRLRRRAIFRGGACRHRWQDRGPTGELDGAPFHPCHPPTPAATCTAPRCASGCPAARGDRYADHLAGCDRGCPTRTGLRQSRCSTHPPRELHKSGCPRTCAHHGHKRGRNCAGFEHDPVAGGLASFDVTWSSTARDPWNLHLHMLLDAPWLAWAELRDLWVAVTCQTRGCRHQRRADGSPDPRCTGAWMVWIVRVDQADEDRRRGAIREVLKYVAKPHGIVDSLDPARVEEYLWATRHQRIVQGWGCWYRVQLDDADEADAEHHVIRWGFTTVRVPRICPVCRAETTELDWGFPFNRGRLEADRLPHGYGWRHPPPLEPILEVPISAGLPPAAPTQAQEGFAW
jgi:hypothetical protein